MVEHRPSKSNVVGSSPIFRFFKFVEFIFKACIFSTIFCFVIVLHVIGLIYVLFVFLIERMNVFKRG